MYRIRFHGRGGQGMKTASRILGTACLSAGFEVQDAPRYGAERRGAPMSAYVRASREAINERGIIRQPGLVVVADETLVPIPAAGVLAGIAPSTMLLIASDVAAAIWRERLAVDGPILMLPLAHLQNEAGLPLAGVACAAAAARLLGGIDRNCVSQAVRDEVAAFGQAVVARNLEVAMWAYDAMADHAGSVAEGGSIDAADYAVPAWVDLMSESVAIAAPAMHAGVTSVQVRTGLWRIMRPIIDYDRCNRCSWVCGSFCPDSAIHVRSDGFPEIDYEHCKGCMICVAQCPPHAIAAIPETAARDKDAKEPPS